MQQNCSSTANSLILKYSEEILQHEEIFFGTSEEYVCGRRAETIQLQTKSYLHW